MGIFGPPNIEKLKASKNVEGLIKALKDEDSDARWRVRVAEALYKMGDSQYLERLLREEDERIGIDVAEELVNIGGIAAIPILTNALKDDRTLKTAAWALAFPLRYKRKQMDEEKLQKALIPAIQYLIGIIEGAKISGGARSFNESVAVAINALGEIGDLSTVTVLESLLEKVKQKIKVEGIIREYVDTGIARGYISTQDDLSHIERAIETIRKREKERGK